MCVSKMADYYRVIIILICCSVFLISCNEETDEPGMANVSFALVDAPGDFDSLILSVEDVFYNLSGSDTDWQSLDGFRAGNYDLLKLVNGKEWLLGEMEFPTGRLSQVRLLLGTGNRLYIGDSAIFLPVPSGNRSGLKINVNEELEAGRNYKLVIDFDADKSLVQNGNSGDYTLKPVLRGSFESSSGAIKGTVLNAGQRLRIRALRGSESFRTISNRNGGFLLRALKPGIYDVVIQNPSGLDLTVEEVAIRAGGLHDLGELRLFQ